MNFASSTKKRIFKNNLCLNLASFAVNFKFEDEDKMILSFIIAAFSFIGVYTLICLLATVDPSSNKKKQGKNHIRAFYFTIIALFANNIISYIVTIANYLFEIDLEGILGFTLLISMGTTPFFTILLITWLSIKAFQYLRNQSRK
jgi:hypothetical protein